MFGSRLELAVAYHDSLVTAGPIRGLNGPREIPVLWSRHIINSALVGYLPSRVLPEGATVCDVGSGAGLPGIPLAIARPDLQITLLDPLERRTNYLREIVAELELTNVRVLRGRADPGRDATAGEFAMVTSRAVAPLERLLSMCLPLIDTDGWFAALKGKRANQEIDELAPAVRKRVRDLEVLTTVGPGDVDVATVVVARAVVHDSPRGIQGKRRSR
ncbi:16S rRNA (guanine(527)-N(7))-methyltransferase RsmG [Antricoccus suffuscus]|uniref:16S rRNA (guanine(527)-N(7))-methyltransferase RsmG n=1 Tax=Antricoccus suffuscus TaxID=1629062 RepID=UPI003B50C104